MLVVGLTGGIASGKSSVSRLFEQLGVPVIDTDIVARQLVEPGQAALEEIVQQFGAEILNPDRTLNRRRLRDQVFTDPDSRVKLEIILHPRIATETEARLGQIDASYCLVVIPLLLESGLRGLVDRVLVVDAARERQLARLRERDGGSAEQIEAILATQLSREERNRQADDTIPNHGALAELTPHVERLHQKYLHLAT